MDIKRKNIHSAEGATRHLTGFGDGNGVPCHLQVGRVTAFSPTSALKKAETLNSVQQRRILVNARFV